MGGQLRGLVQRITNLGNIALGNCSVWSAAGLVAAGPCVLITRRRLVTAGLPLASCRSPLAACRSPLAACRHQRGRAALALAHNHDHYRVTGLVRRPSIFPGRVWAMMHESALRRWPSTGQQPNVHVVHYEEVQGCHKLEARG